MPITVLFAADDAHWAQYHAALKAAFARAGLDAVLTRDAPDPAAVDYMVFAPGGPISDFTPFTRLKAVLSLWAGVENITTNATLRAPLARMVDEGLSEGMADWVSGHVLRHHLGMDRHILGQDGVWRHADAPPLARDRRVAILGLGTLGRACARVLVAHGFDMRGWSRTQKSISGVECRAGDDGLDEVLRGAEILVLLLPQTAATQNLMDAEKLALLPQGAVIINPGRGTLIDDAALLAALDSGQIEHATLDVFRAEPLAPEHPYWAHPRVTVTPHIAAETRPLSAARVIAENIQRAEAGQALLHLVNRAAGY